MPSDTLSPSLTLSSAIFPAAGDGISMVALSDSTVISDCSADTVSPGFTRTSMIATSLKSPMSGTLTVMGPLAVAAGFCGVAAGAETGADAGAALGSAGAAFGSGFDGADAPPDSSSTRIGEP